MAVTFANMMQNNFAQQCTTQIDNKDSKHPTPILAVWTISATFAPC